MPKRKTQPTGRASSSGRRALRAFLLLLLFALGAYFATQYLEDRKYARYPLRYREQIAGRAQENGLEPSYVAAVILCESSYRERALSSAGARGLMQIMPETGRWIAEKLGQADAYTDEALYEAHTSIQYGCWYLQWLALRYHENLACVTGAYHAGQGQMDEWLASAGGDAASFTAADIPSAATAKYVQRVLDASERYKELYDFEQ